METVHKSMESVSKTDSGYTVSLIDSVSGDVLCREPLKVHDVDHATHKVWSARLPEPKVPSPYVSLMIQASLYIPPIFNNNLPF